MAVIQQALAMATAGTSYETEATALFARFSSDPGTTRKDAINTCIASLKSGGVWSKLSNLYVLAAHDSQAAKLNWITNARNLTETGTGTFTVDQGYTSSSSYLTAAVDDGVLYLQNSAHVSIWVRNNVQEGNIVLNGTGGSETTIYPRYTDDSVYVRVHDSSATSSFTTVVTSAGFLLGNRSSSTAREAYKNGSSIGTKTQASGAAATAYKIGESSSMQISVVSFGGSLTSGEVTSFYNALNTLKTAIGW